MMDRAARIEVTPAMDAGGWEPRISVMMLMRESEGGSSEIPSGPPVLDNMVICYDLLCLVR
jgi:hypothetical protein